MDRKEAIRNYNWRPLHARVEGWYASRRLEFLEAPVSAIESGFGVTHCIPRASTLLIKLRYESRAAFFLLMIPATLRANLTVMCKTYHACSAWMATLGEVHHLTRSVSGCVPPIGSLFGLPVVIDARLRGLPEVFAPSGQPGYALRLPMAQFATSEKPQFLDNIHRAVYAHAAPSAGELALTG